MIPPTHPIRPQFPLARLPIERVADRLGTVPLLGSLVCVIRLTISTSAIVLSIVSIACAKLLIVCGKTNQQAALNRWKFTLTHFMIEGKHSLLHELIPGLSRTSADHERTFKQEMMKAILCECHASRDLQINFLRLYTCALRHRPLPPISLSREELQLLTTTIETYQLPIPDALWVKLFTNALHLHDYDLIHTLGKKIDYNEDILYTSMTEDPALFSAICTSETLLSLLLSKISSTRWFATLLDKAVREFFPIRNQADWGKMCRTLEYCTLHMERPRHKEIALALLTAMTNQEIEWIIFNGYPPLLSCPRDQREILHAILNKVPTLHASLLASHFVPFMEAACANHDKAIISMLLAKQLPLNDSTAVRYAFAAIRNGHSSLCKELHARGLNLTLIWLLLPPLEDEVPIEELVRLVARENGARLLSILCPCSRSLTTNWLHRMNAHDWENSGLSISDLSCFIEFCVQNFACINGEDNKPALILEISQKHGNVEMMKALLKCAKRDEIKSALTSSPSFLDRFRIEAQARNNFTSLKEILQTIAAIDKTLLDELIWHLYWHPPVLPDVISKECMRSIQEVGGSITIDLLLSKPLHQVRLFHRLPSLNTLCKTEEERGGINALSKQLISLEAELSEEHENLLLPTLCLQQKHIVVRLLLSKASEAAILQAIQHDVAQSICRFLCYEDMIHILPQNIAKSGPVLNLLLRYACQHHLVGVIDAILQKGLLQNPNFIWEPFQRGVPDNATAIMQVFIARKLNINHLYILDIDDQEDEQENVLVAHTSYQEKQTRITLLMYSCANQMQPAYTALSGAGGLCFPAGIPCYLSAQNSELLNSLCWKVAHALNQDPEFRNKNAFTKAHILSGIMARLLGVWCYYDSLGPHHSEQSLAITNMLEQLNSISMQNYSRQELEDLFDNTLSDLQQGTEIFKTPLAVYGQEIMLTQEYMKMYPERVLLIVNPYYNEWTKVRFMNPDQSLSVALDMDGLTRAFFADILRYLFDNGKHLPTGLRRLIKIPHGELAIPTYRSQPLPQGLAFACDLELSVQDQIFINVGILFARCCINFTRRKATPIGKVLPSSYFVFLHKLIHSHQGIPNYKADQPIALCGLMKAFVDVYGTPADRERYRIALEEEQSTPTQCGKFYFLRRMPFLEATQEQLEKMDSVTALLDYIARPKAVNIAEFAIPADRMQEYYQARHKEWRDCLKLLQPLIAEGAVQMKIAELLKVNGERMRAAGAGDHLTIEEVDSLLREIHLELPLDNSVSDEAIDFIIQLTKVQSMFPPEAHRPFLTCRERLLPLITAMLPLKNLQQEMMDQGWSELQQYIRPAVSIIQGMKSRLHNFLSHAPEILEEAIQGEAVGRKQLAERIELVADDNSTAGTHILTWFQKYIENGDEQQAIDLLFACAGQRTLTQDRIKLKIVPNHNFVVHTCSRTVDVPLYPNDANGRAQLIERLQETIALSKSSQAYTMG